MDTVICVVVPQSTEGEVAPLAPALLSVTDINGMSLKGSSKYIEHLLFMFALTSEDMVNCIMQSLSIFIFLRVAFLQFVTLLVTSLFSTLNKFSTVENFYTYREFNNYAQIKDVTSIIARVYTVGNLAITSIIVETPKLIGKTTIKFPIKYKALPFVTFQDNDTASTPPGPLGINWTNLDSIEVQGFNGGFTMLVVGAI